MTSEPAIAKEMTKGELSSESLLEIAATLFRDHGYAGTTMREIAKKAGMKAGSLYYHFESKDEILDLVICRGINETINAFEIAMRQLPQDASFRDRLCAAIQAHLETIQEFGSYTVASRQLLSQIPGEMREKHRARRQDYDDMWRDLLRAGHEEGQLGLPKEPGVTRMFLIGSLNWASEWMDTRKKSSRQLARIAADLFLDGLAGNRN